MKLLYLDPRVLEADPNGVREDPGNVDGLAATISEHGLLQPLGVLDAGHGRYRVVYGNRRREAAVQLGLERVPCIILDADDPHTLIQQLTENVQRQDLNDLEKPRVLLLDEPLSALDAKLRDAMRSELTSLQQKVGITFIMVTHDQDEALAMATRCAVMNRGLLQQVATPSDLYEFPNSRFVADFIGSVNMFEGTLDVDEPDHAIVNTTEAGPVYLDHGVTGATGTTVWAAVRPEKIEMLKRTETPPKVDDAPEGYNVIAGVVKHMVYLGSETNYEVEIAGGKLIKVVRPNLTRWDQEDFELGEKVWLTFHACSPAVLLS